MQAEDVHAHVLYFVFEVSSSIDANQFYRVDPLDENTFQILQQGLFTYIQTEFVFGPAERNATCMLHIQTPSYLSSNVDIVLRNKFSHIISLFFVCVYPSQYPTFFNDLFSLIRPPPDPSSISASFNSHISLLLFHVVIEISGEVADQLLKSARVFSGPRHARDTRVRDAVRERDAPIINEAVLTIISDTTDRMRALRKGELAPAVEREEEVCEEVVDWGIRAFGSYIRENP